MRSGLCGRGGALGTRTCRMRTSGQPGSVDASGTTVAQAARGRGGWRLYVACFFVVVYVLLVVADSVLVALAADSSDPLLLLPDLVQKYLLDNVPYVLAWFAAMANFGLSIHHFVPWRSVDATEEMLKRRPATVAPAPED